jgi:hypothetical protein
LEPVLGIEPQSAAPLAVPVRSTSLAILRLERLYDRGESGEGVLTDLAARHFFELSGEALALVAGEGTVHDTCEALVFLCDVGSEQIGY